MTRRHAPLVLVAALAVAAGALGAGCGPEAEASPGAAVVARVGGGVVTLDEVAEAYAELVVQAGLDGEPQALDAVVTSLVSRRLLIEGALADGVAETEAYRAARALAETKALVDRYTARTLRDELAVTEADEREMFVQMNTTTDARHLYARDLATAQALRRRLLAGETFQALARETFADPALAATGGRVGPFGHDELDPAFEAAAFRLPIGEVSEPVRTATGYSVIRVDARASNPLLTEDEFARRRGQIRRYVAKRKRTEARFRLSRETRDDLSPEFTDAFDRLVAFATGAVPNLDAEALAAWRRTPLVRFESDVLDGVWTVGHVEDLAASMTDRQRAAVQDAATLRDFVEGLLVREELAARARATGLDDAAVQASIARRMDDWVFDEAKRRLRADVDVPEAALRAHFDAHRADFVTPERVRATEILVETRAQADALRRRLAAGEDPGALARAYSVRPRAATLSGDLGPVTRGQLGALADPVFEAAPGAVVGPVEVAGRFVLVARGETLAPRPMTFDEARPDVRAALDAEYAQRRLTQALDGLRARFPVRVDRDVLAPLLAAR
ncbi:peptidylprolyl isomerase [Rubrivirga sp.]|uniref:peptidylprolyl isomerase n=1 Tax=Rubrivirga sp. TaxID=1885344 RepID=UPI003B5269BA